MSSKTSDYTSTHSQKQIVQKLQNKNRRRNAMSRKSRTCQSKQEMGCARSETKSVQENLFYEDLEETKEDTVASIKSITAHKMCIDLSLRKAGENSSMAIFHTVGDSTAGEEKCTCQKDIALPCCTKAKEWVRMMFDNKGIIFNHTKYKDQYLVLFINN